MVPSDSSHPGVVDNSPNGFTQGLKCPLLQLWYSVTVFTFANPMQKNDRRIIATVCMFLAGKVEETPRPLKDVIVVSYEIIHKKDPNAGQRIKQQKEIYDKQKELILLGERIVLVTLGFDLNIHHAYKPLVEAIRRFDVGDKGGLPQLPSDGDKIWWQDFDVTPRQLEDHIMRKKSSPAHNYPKTSPEFRNPKEEHKPHRAHDNSHETRDGVLGGNEAPSVSTSRVDAMNRIDKDKVKAALEKRRKSKGGVAANVNMMDDDDLLEREIEHGVELAVEDEKTKQDKQQDLSHGSMPPVDLQHVDHVMENGQHGEQSMPTTAEAGDFPMDRKRTPSTI
ncbi:hypothetical protein HU200_011614 [Digitaria exilis]|uniref:Cyclin N-terminal domain-containing protein n=1 Tax=Digitaria exilis TaxID=1010633 RepID=A0A835FGV8_9POAL|nr:hypothetical protein HU200_011614 [Digitaria exilis]